MTGADRNRFLAAELYRPDVAGFIVLGEAPPPLHFFYYGDSLFLRYLRRAFAPLVAEAEARDAGWFLAFFRDIGGWRIDVCETPQRASKGGAENVEPCLGAFERRWNRQERSENSVVVVSPKRLASKLPVGVSEHVTACVPPPGQWNAHREAFLRDIGTVLARDLGRELLRRAAAGVDDDMAGLDFEIARACADGAEKGELRRLVRGHPRETTLWAAWAAHETEA